ncbi:LysM peptidoglycan-binding domain-containing protein [Mycobacterium sp.]|jgi:hypothetical protein|uniref:LysM peptidoglycan-binding domain-containing protein n=1 Tax=Mycobacterium sp. TaxID=1785 RepID=UPI002D6EBB05|nr:LysM peptidoglycan-binding domain-containing protein [Mycobacterium sp.]HZA10428.1 LysM peptidoglycan-binding domain-containing protein [Mycobacterium sp.]
MTLIDTGQPVLGHVVRARTGAARARQRTVARRRPGPPRPAVGALRFSGTGVAMSRAPHRRRPVSAAITAALAGLAALITVWLGAIAHSGGVVGRPAAVPEQLAVVQVQAGESLQGLAARVAPDAPVGQVVSRIRELNQLHTASLDAGQTLIAPVAPSADRAR